MRPSPEADRRTLIRRVTYDLTGLPPTPGEIASFLADRSPRAYEKVVDRLLASPRYGERWARHWLDVAHYGDTQGYDKDKRRDHAWPYRDYVIRALNEDRPYPRFIEEQVAGDVLFPGSPDGVVATGFLAAGPWDFVGNVELAEGTVEKEKTRLLDRDDTVANVIGTFDSVTIHCARCHDHKFDPIPQRDYYNLQAVFAGVERGDRPFGDPAAVAARAAVDSREAELRRYRAALMAKVAALTSPEIGRLDSRIGTLRAERDALPTAAADPSPSNGYHSGIESRPDVEKWVQVDLGRAVPIERIVLAPARPTDFADTPGFGFPVRYRVAVSDDPSFARSEVVLDRTAVDAPNPGDAPVIGDAGGRRARYVRVTALKLWPRTNDFVFALAELQVESQGRNAAAGAAVTALDSIEQGRWSTRYLVDDFDSRVRIAAFADPAVGAAMRRRRVLEGEIARAEAARTAAHDALIDSATAAALREADAGLADVAARRARLAQLDQVFAVISRAPRPIHLLARGDVEKPGAPSEPGALSCVAGLPARFDLPPSAGEGERRAALARWIASPSNPLTWRSIVNRVWAYHFGRGIVDTPNDFGRNGGRPTHPELLDWLATDFRAAPSLKRLHRLIVLSAAYRQSSADNPDFARHDGDNRLLWRMNRRRLDAEEVRDSVLAVSGALDLKMGGPGFELFRFKDDHSPVYDYGAPGIADRPETWRRAIYAFTVRSVPNPFIECLDGADPNLATPVRSTTVTALQALALLNDPFILRQSETFAGRLAREQRDPAAQIGAAYAYAFGRAPSPAERSDLAAFAARHGVPAACRLLYNANEFLFVD